jgi:4-amino-4-deoxy-L-arabinose transferase-like glycosyltransferase
MVLALAVINLNLTERDIKWLIFLILGILLLQVPVSAIQCSIWTLGDWCVGTLSTGGTSDMVFLCCLGVSLVISLYVYYQKKSPLLMLVSLFALPIIFGNNQMGIFLYPFTILLVFMYDINHNAKVLLLTLGIICAFIAVLYLLIPPFQATAKRYVSLLDVSFKNQLVVSPDTLGRLKAPGVATEWLSKKDDGWLFGYGFGITKESHWKQTTGEYAHKEVPNKNQISTAIFETGYIGLVLFLSLFVCLFVWGHKMVKRLLNFSKSIALTFTCAVSLMIIGSIYTNVLKSYYFGFLFWVMFACLYTLNSHCLKGTQAEIS